MEEGMSPVRGTRRPALLLRTLVVAGALAGSMAGPAVGVASADEPAGTTVVGRLVQAYPEEGPGDQHAGSETTAPLSWVQTSDGAVRVPTADLPGVPAGATVELTVGDPVEDEGAEEHGLAPAQEVLSTGSVTPVTTAAPARGPVTNEVTVVLVAPAGTQPDTDVTPQDVAAPLDTTVADFWADQTGGAVRFGVTATHDWISTTAGCAEPTALWDETAAAVGFRAGPGKHLMLYLASQTATQPGCSYALAEVGAGPTSGGRLYVRDRLPSVMAHELGHNLGLSHSSGLQCDGTLETGTCRTSGYRDYYDVMGVSWRQLGSLNAPQAALLGALPAGAARQLGVRDAATSVELSPLAGGTGTRAVRLVDAEGAAYWLEYRAATGQDGWLGRPGDNRYRLDSGVLLRRSADFPDTSVLLDGTPSEASGWDGDLQAALPVGVPVVLSDGDFTVTVRSLVDGAAAVDVVPTAPATTAAAVPSPRDSGAGRVLGGTDASARAALAAPVAPAAEAPAAATAGEPAPAQPWSPAQGSTLAARTPVLDPASGSTPTAGLLIACSGAGLAGLVLLVVRRARRSCIR
jgi:hypothetical protein